MGCLRKFFTPLPCTISHPSENLTPLDEFSCLSESFWHMAIIGKKSKRGFMQKDSSEHFSRWFSDESHSFAWHSFFIPPINVILSIQWKKIKDTRNRIVHDYAGVDFDITFEIVTKEIPQLITDMERIVREEIHAGTFSLEELNIAHNSDWYLHVDFTALK